MIKLGFAYEKLASDNHVKQPCSLKYFTNYRRFFVQHESAKPSIMTLPVLSARSFERSVGRSIGRFLVKALTLSLSPKHSSFPALRLYSSSASSSNGFHPSVGSALYQLNSFQIPRFELPAKSVEVLSTPSEFYKTLLRKISQAQDRIFLASLYIGPSETELIDAIRQALCKNEHLQVFILTDALRGTREAPFKQCTASLLAPLVAEFGPRRVQLRLYHTPNLHGIQRLLVPKRFNEGWGLQHMKLYGVDNEIILSGANLSNDYFTNRQDRYFVFKSASLTDYYFKLHQVISSLSYKIIPLQPQTLAQPTIVDKLKKSVQKLAGLKERPDPTFKLLWDPSVVIPEPTKDPRGFIEHSSRIVQPFLRGPASSSAFGNRSLSANSENADAAANTDEILTYVYPISQLSPLFEPSSDASTELPVVNRILSMLSLNHFNWVFTAGYFNILPEFVDKLLHSSPPHASVIAASPLANGFYKSKGVSGLLPDAYSLLASKFLEKIYDTRINRLEDSKIDLLEWQKGTVNTPGGWSYHAKGLWIFEPSEHKESEPLEHEEKEYTKATQENKWVRTLRPVFRPMIEPIVKLFDKPKLDAEGNPIPPPPPPPRAEPRSVSKIEADESLAKPVMTIIGSSNYTRRAYAHDLESNAVVVTKDPELQRQLRSEVINILKYSRKVSLYEYEQRKPTNVLRGLTWLLGDKL